MHRATTVNYITVKKQHPQSTHWNHKRNVQTKMQGQTATTNTLQNCNKLNITLILKCKTNKHDNTRNALGNNSDSHQNLVNYSFVNKQQTKNKQLNHRRNTQTKIQEQQ